MPRDPRPSLRAAGEEYQAAKSALANTRQHLQSVIIRALKAGVPQVEVVQLTGYTRESIRTIARKNGIEAR